MCFESFVINKIFLYFVEENYWIFFTLRPLFFNMCTAFHSKISPNFPDCRNLFRETKNPIDVYNLLGVDVNTASLLEFEFRCSALGQIFMFAEVPLWVFWHCATQDEYGVWLWTGWKFYIFITSAEKFFSGEFVRETIAFWNRFRFLYGSEYTREISIYSILVRRNEW